MKIAIITTQFLNYGSRLQNLATIELLKKQYPGAQIFTLIPSKTHNKLVLLLKNSRLLQSLFLKLKFRGKINKNNKLLNYKAFFVKDFSINELSFLDKKYDLFVVGSDQIWNYPNGDKSNFQFAMFTKNKICNAPSFALSKETSTPRMRMLLESFKNLNVREKEAADYINNVLKIKCEQLIDPTLRLPLTKWKQFSKNSKNNNYVLVYILGNKMMEKEILGQTNNSNKNLITIFNSNDEKSKFKYSPTEFISCIANASEVITNSFHGACLAKIFGKKLEIYRNNRSDDARFDFFENYENLIKIN